MPVSAPGLVTLVRSMNLDLQELEPAEQVAVSRRCGCLNTTPLNRRDILHLHGLYFCLRLGREEELALAKRLAAIAMDMPASSANESSCWADLIINGTPATLQEDERFWSMVTMFCANRPRPDDTWDEQGTLEFTIKLPLKWRRHCAAVKLQTAVRGMLARRKHASYLRDQQLDDAVPVDVGES
jgi:hypothetical protein